MVDIYSGSTSFTISGSTSCNISSKSTMDSHGGWLTPPTRRKLSKCPSQSSKTTVLDMDGWKQIKLVERQHAYLEPVNVGPFFGGLNPPKQGPFQAKQGSFGFQVYEHFCRGHAPTVSLTKKNDSTPTTTWRDLSHTDAKGDTPAVWNLLMDGWGRAVEHLVGWNNVNVNVWRRNIPIKAGMHCF